MFSIPASHHSAPLFICSPVACNAPARFVVIPMRKVLVGAPAAILRAGKVLPSKVGGICANFGVEPVELTEALGDSLKFLRDRPGEVAHAVQCVQMFVVRPFKEIRHQGVSFVEPRGKRFNAGGKIGLFRFWLRDGHARNEDEKARA